MKPWPLEEIRRATKARWAHKPAGLMAFNGRISTDSRKTQPGELFIAIAGEKHDAHRFLSEVFARKPAAVLVHEAPSAELLAQAQDVAVLVVDNTVAALNRLAAAYRAELRAKVIAVGGANGKTTTKFIIHTLLSQKFSGHASPKSFNNHIGMPLTLLEVETAHDFVVLELGTNHPGEIAALGEVCRPDIAVITSIGLEHLEFFKDLGGVAREEAAIANCLGDNATLILPAGSSELLGVLKNSPQQKILVGQAGGAEGPPPEFLLTGVVQSAGGTAFSINQRGNFFIPLFGEHNAMNALMAVAVARRLGLSDEQIVAGLAKVQPPDMRFQPLPAAMSGPFSIINDAYNANPSSMQASLKTFAALPREGSGGRRIVILADMLELGPASPALHRGIGELVAQLGFDLFIAIGHNMKHAADAAFEGRAHVRHFPSTLTAKAMLQELLHPGDRILLKGSRSMALETLLDTLRQFPMLAPASS